MTTYYVHSGITGSTGLLGLDTVTSLVGNDSNLGTSPAAPFLTLTHLQSVMTNGDTAYLAGRFYTPDATLYAFHKTSLVGCFFLQWSGQAAAQIRGANKAGKTSWTASGSGYYKTIGTGLSIRAVVYDYDSVDNVDDVGRRTSFLKPPTFAYSDPAGQIYKGAWSGATAYIIGDTVTSGGTTYMCLLGHTNHVPPNGTYWVTYASLKTTALAAGGGVQGKWAYDPATGELAVGLPESSTPSSPVANGVEYAVAGRIGIGITSLGIEEACGPNVIDGLNMPLWVDSLTGSPYGSPIVVQNADGSSINNCVFNDSGIHAISIGIRVTDVTTQNNVSIGQGQNGIAYVFNASGTTSGDNNVITNCTSTNDVSYCHTFLGHDGNYIVRGGCGGFIVHGGINDVEFINPQVIEYTQPGGGTAEVTAHFSCNQDSPVILPDDYGDPETYPIIFRQTNPNIFFVSNGTFKSDQGGTSNVAFINTRWQFSRFGDLSNGNCMDLYSNAGVVLFYANELQANMNNTGRDLAMFGIGDSTSILRINCSLYDTATVHGSQKYAIDNFEGTAHTGVVSDTGSIYGWLTATGTRLISMGDSNAAYNAGAGHGYSDIMVYNVGSTTYSENTSLNSAAEWLSVIDPDIQVVTDNPFLDESGLTLDLTRDAKNTRKVLSTHCISGVNGVLYAANYGAYQYDLTNSQFVQINVITRPGRTIYAVLRNPATNQFFNVEAGEFQSPNIVEEGDWVNYVIPLFELVDSHYYNFVDPTQAGLFVLEAWDQDPTGPDPDVDIFVGEDIVYWDGTKELTLVDSLANEATILSAISSIVSSSGSSGVVDGFTQSDRELLQIMFNKIQRNSESGGPRGVA